MKDRMLLLSAFVACSLHALLLFADFGMARPELPSAVASIEVTLVAPPESAIAPAREPAPIETSESAVEPEQVKPEPPAQIEPISEPEPEPQPTPESVAEPEPVPEPAPTIVEEIRRVTPDTVSAQEPVPQVERLSLAAPTSEANTLPDTESAEGFETLEEVAADTLESSLQTEYHVPTVDRSPAYTYNPKPKYPRAARRRGQQGTVLLLVEVLPSGRVGKIEIDEPSGYEILDRAAVDAVRKWSFVPATRGSASVRAWVRIPVEFNLRDRE